MTYDAGETLQQLTIEKRKRDVQLQRKEIMKDVCMYNNSLFQNSGLVLLTRILPSDFLFSYTKIAEEESKRFRHH